MRQNKTSTLESVNFMRQNKTLTLESAVAMIKATEVANKEIQRIINEQSQSTSSISSITKSKRLPKKPQINSSSNVGSEEYLCTKYCGYWHTVGKCPAFGQYCLSCGRKNHFKRVCWNTMPDQTREMAQ